MLNTTEKLKSRFTSEEEAFYRREGYLIYKQPVFSPEKFQRLQQCFEDILADLPEGFSTEMMDVPHFTFTQLYEWLFSDEILSMVIPFLGDDIALWSSHFLSKPGGVASASRGMKIRLTGGISWTRWMWLQCGSPSIPLPARTAA